MRGGSLGHHQALEKEERFSRFQSEEFGTLVWVLGAMAAERVFYGENTNGVGGDVQSATAQAAWMVGASAMGPEPFDGHAAATARPRRRRAQRVLKRFETIGLQIMNRTSGGGPFDGEPDRGRPRRPRKRQLAAQILGQAYVIGLQPDPARTGTRSRRSPTSSSSAARCSATNWSRILDGVGLERPDLDLEKEDVWPKMSTSEPTPAESDVLVPTRRDRARQTSYRFRFGILYVVLAAIVGAGVGTFVVLATRPAPPEAAAWSSWEPNGSKLARVRQIADRIPKAYTQPNGEQLTVSQASQLAVPTESGDVPISSIFVRPDTSRGQAEESDIEAYNGADVVSYGLCGLGSGSQCSISEGTPSSDRFTLLSRQALELSLYTFKYVEGRRLGDRLHAADAEGREQRLGVPASRRRQRRAAEADLPSAAVAHPTRRSTERGRARQHPEIDPAADLRLPVRRSRRRQADPRAHAACCRFLTVSRAAAA